MCFTNDVFSHPLSKPWWARRFPAWRHTKHSSADAARDYEGFWGRLAKETLSWKKPFTRCSTNRTRRSIRGSKTAS
ncbi:acetyl-coenzyme A synthetase N-terminal domain-containing protein [Burkholderia multivorans]|uniref:acetyl-coenzyme A synthetase N-terminal domain-containing protein n=1 Tax=Burkholderia multivorans TaxID=87883 RepID=UPI0030ED226B